MNYHRAAATITQFQNKDGICRKTMTRKISFMLDVQLRIHNSYLLTLSIYISEMTNTKQYLPHSDVKDNEDCMRNMPATKGKEQKWTGKTASG